MSTSKANAVLVESLGRSLRATESGLGTVPDLLRRVLEEDAWREFTTPRGELVQHGDFETFVTTPPLGGLGVTVDLVRRIVADDPVTLDLLDQALQNPPGRPETNDNVQGSSAPTGNSEPAAMRRLRREAEAGNEQAAELRDEVLAGRLSAHKAMVQAGFRPRTFTVPVDRPESVAQTLRKHMKPDQLRELRRLLDEP
jgi:hypothetical protein